MKLVFYSSLIFVFSIYLSGCGGKANAESPLPESEIERLHNGEFTANGLNTPKQSKVIKSIDNYQSELLIYSNEEPVDINFSDNQILLVDMGSRTSGGYSISIDNSQLLITDNSVTVAVVLTIPGNGCVTTDAITNPYAFYRVPTQKEILIHEELVVEDCN